MRAFASSFHAWKELERNEGTKVPHGLVFPLAIVEAIGRPHGLSLVAEEHEPNGPSGFDAIFCSVLDSRCMVPAARHFRAWGIPFRQRDRAPVGRWPLVWAGGQGLHNPLPFADVADLIVIGDGEQPIPALLALWERHGSTLGFLAAASTVPGVFVPSHHDPREAVIAQSVSPDVGITLREEIDVSHNGQRRIEIARGCKYKCSFCSLGWRTPVRENSAADVIATIRRSPKIVHLQAGDAESHSGIAEIREALREHGGRDNGWTGRLDTLLDNPDVEIGGAKKYAFGVEAVSHRLRAAIGKGYLTDERLVADTLAFFSRVEPGHVGRGAWHVIAGLPTERRDEALLLLRVLARLDAEVPRRGGARNLTIHWQPFQPLPGTPMQWCGAGGGARRLAATIKGAESQPWVRVRQLVGRTDDMARICTVLARSDARGAALLDRLSDGPVLVDDAIAITGSTDRALNPDDPLPWDFIATGYPRATLRRAYDVMMRRLADVAPSTATADEYRSLA